MKQSKEKEIKIECIFSKEKQNNVKKVIIQHQELKNTYIKEQTKNWDETTKEQYLPELEESFNDWHKGYIFAQKQFKKEIKDKYNHYNSKLKEATKTKLDKRGRTEYIIKLEAKVELLKSMIND